VRRGPLQNSKLQFEFEPECRDERDPRTGRRELLPRPRSPLLELVDQGVAFRLAQSEPKGMPRQTACPARIQKLPQTDGPPEVREPRALAHAIQRRCPISAGPAHRRGRRRGVGAHLDVRDRLARPRRARVATAAGGQERR
jgi:hypothetical protein